MVVFSDNKEGLFELKDSISDFLAKELNLELKHNWQVWPLDKRFLNFVGYKFYRNKTTLRGRTFLRFRQSIYFVKRYTNKEEKIPKKQVLGFVSRVGNLKNFCSTNFRKKYLININTPKIKNIVRNLTKRNAKDEEFQNYFKELYKFIYDSSFRL